MQKEFLNLDEFMALLASHGYQWGDANANNLIMGALNSNELTPVFFYDGFIDLAYKKPKPAQIKELLCYLWGYVSLPCEEITYFYINAVMRQDDTLIVHDHDVSFYKAYGEQVPEPSESEKNSQNIQTYFAYINHIGYEVAFNELVYPTEQVKNLFSTAPTMTTTQNETIRLSIELEQARATIDQQKERIAELEQASQPNEELEIVPHQSYRAVDRVIYAMAILTKLDNTSAYSRNHPSLNAAIETTLINEGLTLGHEAIGKWLTRIKQLK